jgi:hypothetical protein
VGLRSRVSVSGHGHDLKKLSGFSGSGTGIGSQRIALVHDDEVMVIFHLLLLCRFVDVLSGNAMVMLMCWALLSCLLPGCLTTAVYTGRLKFGMPRCFVGNESDKEIMPVNQLWLHGEVDEEPQRLLNASKECVRAGGGEKVN